MRNRLSYITKIKTITSSLVDQSVTMKIVSYLIHVDRKIKLSYKNK